jgi:NAD(P)H dehydrogenase (quinone)
MKILIIYAHPKHEGHCATILHEVESNLKSRSIDYEIIDLYKIHFDPRLKSTELVKPFENDPIILDLQDKVKHHDLLIFIYPVWWNSMPAILKGFIDRVFSAGFAFRYKPMIPKSMSSFFEHIFKIINYRFDYGLPEGLLKNKKAIVFATTGGPKYLGYFITGWRFKKLIKKDTLEFFGIKTKVHHIANCRKLDENKIEKIRNKVRKALKNIYIL